MPENKVKKILIIKLRAIGDVLLSTIVLENLRAAFPDARIDFLTEKPSAGILHGNPLLDHLLVFNKSSVKNQPWYKKLLYSMSFLYSVRKIGYDMVFDYFGNPRSAFITLISGARERVGYNYRIRKYAYNRVVISRASQVHEALWHLDALTALGIPVVSKDLSFYIDQPSREFADAFWQHNALENKPVVALNFSGGWPAKKWPLERFSQIAELIQKKYNARIIVLWGPGEKQEALRLQEISATPLLLIPETDLKQLGAILTKTDLMVSTDSGPMHIAAAVKTACVAIFGPTNFRLQGPYGEIHEIVVKDKLECLGCNRLDCDHRTCMEALTVETVFKSVVMCVERNRLFKGNDA